MFDSHTTEFISAQQTLIVVWVQWAKTWQTSYCNCDVINTWSLKASVNQLVVLRQQLIIRAAACQTSSATSRLICTADIEFHVYVMRIISSLITNEVMRHRSHAFCFFTACRRRRSTIVTRHERYLGKGADMGANGAASFCAFSTVLRRLDAFLWRLECTDLVPGRSWRFRGCCRVYIYMYFQLQPGTKSTHNPFQYLHLFPESSTFRYFDWPRAFFSFSFVYSPLFNNGFTFTFCRISSRRWRDYLRHQVIKL